MRFPIIGLACLLVGLAACGPAPVRLAGRPTGGSGLPLSGVYEARFSATFAGTFTGRITAEPTREGFRANTRPGAAWPLIGGIEEYLGPIFMPYLFPGGAILSWTSTLPADGNPGEGWLGPAGLRRFGIRTLMDAPDAPVRLVLPDGRAIAMMTLRPAPPEASHASFPAVAERMEHTIRTRLFVQPVNGKTIPPAGLEGYLSQVRASAALARDDIEFAFGMAMAARNHLKIFPIAIRAIDADAQETLRSWPESDRATVQWSHDESTGIATIKPDVFLGTEDVDRAMAAVLALAPRGLIIDLRNCPGVELSALRTLAWLSPAAVDAGTFYGPDGADSATELRLAAPADFDNAGPLLDAAGAARLFVEPVAQPFDGPVAVLTNRRTAGSAEALAALLQDSGRATVVGDSTAGRVILPRPFDIGQGWILRMPGAGWIALDGRSIAPAGIEPDIRASASAAPTRAAEIVTK
jgi:hypothetical protein